MIYLALSNEGAFYAIYARTGARARARTHTHAHTNHTTRSAIRPEDDVGARAPSGDFFANYRPKQDYKRPFLRDAFLHFIAGWRVDVASLQSSARLFDLP